MREYWIVYTGNPYETPSRFNTYLEAFIYYNECKEWIRDSHLSLIKVIEETLEEDFIEWEDLSE